MSSVSSSSVSSVAPAVPARATAATRARSASSSPTALDDAALFNVAVVSGTLSSDPVERVLDNGDRLLVLQITTVGERGQTSVPIVWRNPPAAAGKLSAGMHVVTAGPVIRRFFRAGGLTQSRVEVVADRVVSVRSRRAVQSLLARAVSNLGVPAGPSD